MAVGGLAPTPERQLESGLSYRCVEQFLMMETKHMYTVY
jgi:hypothetical protein